MSVAAPNEEREDESLRRAQRAHEPSMEEILASIRAIIADDRESAPPSKPGPQIVYSSDQPRAPEPAPEPPASRARAPAPEREAPEPASPTVVWSRREEPEETAELDDARQAEPLLSDEASGAIANSFDSLAAAMAAKGLEVGERLAREMLKPMLKDWLDENLPPLVEQLVKAEIARVTRGR